MSNTPNIDDRNTPSSEKPVQMPVSDPFTGTRAAGPVTSYQEGQRKRGGWGIAARWLIFAILAIFFGLLIYWFMGGNGS
jgi:hypothetical protein